MYGISRAGEDVVGGAVLDHVAAVHHEHVLAGFGDDAEVVRDEDDRRSEPLLHLRSSARGSAPGSSRRARSSARRRSAPPGRTRAPSRSSPAAACRPRTGAGSRARASRGPGCAPARSISIALSSASCLREPEVQPGRLGDLLADREDGVERGHRILEDHRDVVAADLAHLGLAPWSADPRRGAARRPRSIRPGGCGMSRMIESAVTDLPEPDSPTIPSVVPASTDNDSPLTARTIPSSVANDVARSTTSRSGASSNAGERDQGGDDDEGDGDERGDAGDLTFEAQAGRDRPTRPGRRASPRAPPASSSARPAARSATARR